MASISFPPLYVIDQTGKIVDRVGHWEHDRLEKLVRELIEKTETPCELGRKPATKSQQEKRKVRGLRLRVRIRLGRG